MLSPLSLQTPEGGLYFHHHHHPRPGTGPGTQVFRAHLNQVPLLAALAPWGSPAFACNREECTPEYRGFWQLPARMLSHQRVHVAGEETE